MVLSAFSSHHHILMAIRIEWQIDDADFCCGSRANWIFRLQNIKLHFNDFYWFARCTCNDRITNFSIYWIINENCHNHQYFNMGFGLLQFYCLLLLTGIPAPHTPIPTNGYNVINKKWILISVNMENVEPFEFLTIFETPVRVLVCCHFAMDQLQFQMTFCNSRDFR